MAQSKHPAEHINLKAPWLLPLLTMLTLLSIEERVCAANPRLVVSLTVDQLRSDYLDAFMPLYGNDGFKRLVKEGTNYTHVEYPFSQVDCASAVASLFTGTVPYNNGIVATKWLNRSTLQPVFCVADTQVKGVGTSDQCSPHYLSVSTLGDELKLSTEGKALVYGIAPNNDAAILSAGHAADGAFWIDDHNGMWCSSSYYVSSLPAWVDYCNRVDALPSRVSSYVWQPVNSLAGNFSYVADQKMKEPFKHKFDVRRSYRSFKTSGCVNEEVNRLALSCVNTTLLGRDKVTDLLAVTYYAGTYEHRPADKALMELQDTYVRLDQQLGELINAVTAKVGKENVLFVLTSTGHTDDDVSDPQKFRIPTGQFNISRSASLLNVYLGGVYGQGQYVEAVYDSQIFLNHKLIENKQLNFVDVLERSQELLFMMEGVKDVYTSQRLTLGAWTPGISKIRNSFNRKCSGDILVQVSPGWKLVNDDLHQERQVREAYVSFPVIFWGANTPCATISTPITVDRIAPTLAHSIRIRAPNACSVAPLNAVE